jgi:hypothetical protein
MQTPDKAVPWGCRLVADCAPLVVRMVPSASVRLQGSELARRASLPEVANPRGWPAAGELAGLVVESEVHSTASVSNVAWVYTKLRAHRATGVVCDAASVIGLSATSRAGTLRLWPCVAVEPQKRDLTRPLPVPERGPARAVLLAASEAVNSPLRL